MSEKNQTANNRNFNEYIAHQLKIYEGEKVIAEYCDKTTLIYEAMAIQVLRSPENKEKFYEIFQLRVIHFMEKKNAKLIVLKELRSKTFEKSHGLLVNKLDQVLCGLNVQRQAYHGKCFIGNHVHKMLQINSVLDLCNSIPKIVSDLGFIDTDDYNEAMVLSEKFVVFSCKYAKCYNLMNSSEIINENPLSELGYGDQASDKHITEDCNVISMLSEGSNCLADKGFNIQDLLLEKKWYWFVHLLKKGKNFTRAKVVSTKEIARSRVHVEQSFDD
ncbi:uncharacterized protein LOC136090898 [Hydra vulgaris]|uniref:Uncharacterized protein LOC136090898 n=1 Tax=Hydra vulgaris TaxID=6087 RepID=A0ABM4DHI6_HYDVU